MTDPEIEKVARIMLTADGWCTVCQSDLLDQLRRAFPEHVATIDRVDAQRKDLCDASRDAEDAYDCGTGPKLDIWDIEPVKRLTV